MSKGFLWFAQNNEKTRSKRNKNKQNTTNKTFATNVLGVIYGFEIAEMPARVEETDTGLGHYELSLIMYYRGLD